MGRSVRLSVLALCLLLCSFSVLATEVWVSPKEPAIGGNGYVFVTFGNFSYANDTIQLNITDASSDVAKNCNIRLNYKGYGRCRYNFTPSDEGGSWGYATNISRSGAFTVGKIRINIRDKNDLTSIKYGQKTTLEFNLTYDYLLPKELKLQVIPRDLGTGGTVASYIDVDGNGDKDIVYPDYGGLIYVWNNLSRLWQGVPVQAANDIRTADIGAVYYSADCVAGDFNKDGTPVTFCPDNISILRSMGELNFTTSGVAVAIVHSSADFGDRVLNPTLCDVNGDGYPDQIGAALTQGNVTIMGYNESTGFSTIYVSPDWGTGNFRTKQLCDDFDGDGYNEWAMDAGDFSYNLVEVNLTTAYPYTAFLKAGPTTDRGTLYGPQTSYDIDDDGKVEVISAISVGYVSLLEFNKTGLNSWVEDIAYGNGEIADYTDHIYGSGGIQVSDLNMNGIPDFMLVGGINSPPMFFYEYNWTKKNWTKLIAYSNPYVNGLRSVINGEGIVETSYAVTEYVDFDGDGVDEILTAGRYSGNVYIFRFNGINQWDLIYKGWEMGDERKFSGDGILYSATPLSGWLYGTNCIVDDLDVDGNGEEALCFPHDGNIFLYDIVNNLPENNVSPRLYINMTVNDGFVEKIDDRIDTISFEDVRIMGNGESLFVLADKNVALGVSDIVTEDGVNENSLYPRWSDGSLTIEEYRTVQFTTDYGFTDTSAVEKATWSRIKLPATHKIGKVEIWNMFSGGYCTANVIVTSTADSTGTQCTWTTNTTLFDNSADGLNARYPESPQGKSIYFSPIDIACVRESTAGWQGLTSFAQTNNYRTEISIWEANTSATFSAGMGKLSESNLGVHDYWNVTIHVADRTYKHFNLEESFVLPVTWDELPFNMRIVGGTEYYPGQKGQIVAQLKDEFNDPVTTATCTGDYYFPNATLWVNDAGFTHLSAGVYYDKFNISTTTNPDGVYTTIVNCTLGTFSDIDSHTFHISNILLRINQTVNDLLNNQSTLATLMDNAISNQSVIAGLINGLGDLSAAQVWAYSSKNLTYIDWETGSQFVWNATERNLTWFATGGATAQEIWEYTSRNLTYGDWMRVSNLSGLYANNTKTQQLIKGLANITAEDVWAYTSRNLTTYNQTDMWVYLRNINSTQLNESSVWDYSTKVLSNYSGVWSYATRTLTDYNQTSMWVYLSDINLTLLDVNTTVHQIWSNQTIIMARLNAINTSLFNKLQTIQNILADHNSTITAYLLATNQTYWSFFENLANNQTYWLPYISDNITVWLPSINSTGGSTDLSALYQNTSVLLAYLKKINITVTDINQSTAERVWTFSNRNLSSYGWGLAITDMGEVLATKSYYVRLSSVDINGLPRNVTSGPWVTLIDPVLNTIVTDIGMTYISNGLYSYNYTTTAALTSGVWQARVKVNTGGKNQTLTDYWELETNPARVLMEVIDVIGPQITCQISIENEGSSNQEYQYRWWVTNIIGGQYGEAGMVDSGSAAELIIPGENWTTTKEMTPGVFGTYWCKVEVFFGTEKSGASRQFTYTTDAASTGGAGGGGVSIPYPTGPFPNITGIFNMSVEVIKGGMCEEYCRFEPGEIVGAYIAFISKLGLMSDGTLTYFIRDMNGNEYGVTTIEEYMPHDGYILEKVELPKNALPGQWEFVVRFKSAEKDVELEVNDVFYVDRENVKKLFSILSYVGIGILVSGCLFGLLYLLRKRKSYAKKYTPQQ